MHIKRLEFIKDYLSNPPKEAVLGFNMSEYRTFAYGNVFDKLAHKDGTHACGTVCCIAGLAEAFYKAEEIEKTTSNLWGSKDDYALRGLMSGKAAQFLLGLDDDQSRDLFLGKLVSDDLIEITSEDAVFAISSLLETGVVKWEDPKLLHLAAMNDE